MDERIHNAAMAILGMMVQCFDITVVDALEETIAHLNGELEKARNK